MYNTKKIAEDIYYVGASDRRLALFENIYPIPRGVSYNSYLVMDEKTVLMDTVDSAVSRQFFENIHHVLDGRKLDYLVVHHMEPDHCAMIEDITLRYPEVKIVGNAKTIQMIKQFYSFDIDSRAIIVKDGDTLSSGKHTYTFVMAPMVHWPEVMVSYDSYTGALFSADAFGTFGALAGNIFADEVDFENEWLSDARRSFLNIVGKYGVQTMNLLKKAAGLDIKMILPLHGPIWRENIAWFIDKHVTWASYQAETKGALILYGSIYGNTENAANVLASMVADRGVKNIHMYDVSSTDQSVLLAEAFRHSTIVFMSSTYNLEIFTPMAELIQDLKEHLFQNRDVALVENGSWALQAGKKMAEAFSAMKDIRIINDMISIKSSMKEDQLEAFASLADKVAESVNAELFAFYSALASYLASVFFL